MRAERGFSLLEMLIAMTVFGMIAGGVFAVLFRSQVGFELQQAQAELRQQARVALDRLSTELRLAGYGLGNLDEPLTIAGINELQFVGDIDDGDPGPPCGATFEQATNGGAERVTYRLQSGELRRSVDCWNGSSWSSALVDQVVATDLVGAQALFRYFDADGVEIVPAGTELSAAQRELVRTVSVRMDLLDPAQPVEGRQPTFFIASSTTLPNVR